MRILQVWSTRGVAGATALIVLLGVAAGAAGQVSPDGRVALVVGNGAYTTASPLDNPENDAEGVTRALRRLDFEVVSMLNADRDAMANALADFQERTVGADMALVFYAGHGLEMNGNNYLVPVDARLEAASEGVPREMITLDRAIDATEGAPTRIVILDASFVRTTTGADAWPAGVGGKGLLVAYAAAPGQVVLDSTGGGNSPYTDALLRHLEAPGVEVRVMFGNVGGAVSVATDGNQQPVVLSTLIGEHYLAGRGASVRGIR